MRTVIFSVWVSGFCAAGAVDNAVDGNWLWVLILAGLSLLTINFAWSGWRAVVQEQKAQALFDAAMARHHAMTRARKNQP